MDRITNPIMDYPWGSHTAIAALTGQRTSGPQAEMWLGAHPAAPSTLVRGSVVRTLSEVIAADPAGELGPATLEAFGPRLPYLMKLIAPARPLSLQAHPDTTQAAAGHRAGDPAYTDTWGKPELICALAPFTALAGLRPAGQAAALLAVLALPGLKPAIDALGRSDWRTALTLLLGGTGSQRAGLAAGIAGAANVLPASEAALVSDLALLYPSDPAICAPLLLHRHDLAPEQALYLPPGVLHSYLHGFGVEIMGASDNVLRAGLTSKPCDITGLAAITAPGLQPTLIGADTRGRYRSGCPQFQLAVSTPQTRTPLPAGVPRIALCTSHTATVTTVGRRKRINAGRAVYLPASDATAHISGPGTVYWATPGP